MKRTFTLLIAVALSCAAMAQSWDYLKRDLSLNKKDVTTVNDSIKMPIYDSTPKRVYKGNFYGEDRYEIQYDILGYNSTYLPAPIVEEYKFGVKCFKTGGVFITIGAPMAFIGGILWGCATETNKNGQVTVNNGLLVAGEVLVGIGASMVSVSIPLLSFGDHMKRDANWQYRLQKK